MVVIKILNSPTLVGQMWTIKRLSNFVFLGSHKLYNKLSLLLGMLKYVSEGSWVRAFRLQIDMVLSLFKLL